MTRELVDTVNATIILNVAGPEAMIFAAELNVVIKSYQALLAACTGREEANKQAEEEEAL